MILYFYNSKWGWLNEKQNQKYSLGDCFNNRDWNVNICILFTNSSPPLQTCFFLHISHYHFFLIGIYIYIKDAITNSTDANIEEDPEIKKIETNSKAKSFDILSNLSFWCGLVLMIFASHQLKEAPQFSYILFAISGTLTAIWLITLVSQLVYSIKYEKELDDIKE